MTEPTLLEPTAGDLDTLARAFDHPPPPPGLTPGEQRQVAILVVELQDLYSLAEVLNEVELSRVLDRVYTVFSGIVASFGGWVDRSEEGVLMALFGNKSATDKDPERAIRAALEMFDKLQQINRYLSNRGLHLEIKAGVHVGQVAVGADGELLSGDAVTVAAGLDGAAAVNTLLTSKKTRDLVGDTFLYEHLGPIHLEGRRAPVDTWRVVGINPREEGRWHRSTLVRRARFVGRERAMATLQAAWTQARQPGVWRFQPSRLSPTGRVLRPVFVGIKGPAGSGKSRLLHELRSTDDSFRTRPPLVLQARVDPLSRESYSLFVDLLKDFTGIEDEDAPQVRRRKLEAVARPLYVVDPVLKAYLPVLGYLLGIKYPDPHLTEVDPRDLQQEIRIALTALLRAVAIDAWEKRQMPLLLCLEDLHDVDERSLAALLVLLERLESPAPVVVLATWRSPWKPIREVALLTSYQEVALGPLTHEEVQAQIASMLDGYELPAPLLRQVLSLTEGNPFYVEEIILGLVEEKVLVKRKGQWVVDKALVEGSLPESLSGLILARVDTLPRPVRNTLVYASAFGVVFSRAVLAEVCARLGGPAPEPHLQVLVEGRFVRVARAVRGGESYSFRSLLIRQVVYDTLLPDNRRRLHRLIGEAIERAYPDNLAEHYGSLAWHFTEGGEVGQAARYLALAGERAFREYNQALALDCYQRYLALETSGPERLRVCWRLAMLLRRGGQPDEAARLLHQALQGARAAGMGSEGVGMEIDLLLELGRVQRHLGQQQEAVATAEQAVILASRVKDRSRQIDALYALATCLRVTSQVERAREILAEITPLLSQAGDRQREGRVWSTRGRVELDERNYAEASRCFREALACHRDSRDRWGEALELCHLAEAQLLAGELPQARTNAASALALAEPLEMKSIVARARLILGGVRVCLGDVHGADEMLSAQALTQQLKDLPRARRGHELIAAVLEKAGLKEQAAQHREQAQQLAAGPVTS